MAGLPERLGTVMPQGLPAALVVALVFAACEPPTRDDGGVRALSDEALGNATYPTEYLETADSVTLTDGGYRAADGSLEVLLLPQIAVGDLTGDGVPEAAVVLVSQTGGTGSFYDLVVMANERNRARHVTTTALGDRIDLEALGIADRRITVTLVTQGPGDPMCCPTQRELRSYLVTDQGLREAGPRVRLAGVDTAHRPAR